LIRLFHGFDPREEVGTHTFCSSVIHHATQPVAMIPLHLPMLPQYKGGQRDGTNAFIYSRFLIPHLCGYDGFAIFADGADMICRADIAELWALRHPSLAVQVVKHDYKTKHPRKYVGTQMEAANEDYPRKNWSSLMLMNCAHVDWRRITPEAVAKMSGAELHRFSFVEPQFVGELPVEWNWLADEAGENPEAKLCHWTAGIPAWPAYRDAPMADEWTAARMKVTHASL
jgi:hypothetical protein